MNILVVCSGSKSNFYNGINKPFVKEQIEVLQELGIKFEIHFIEGGWMNYPIEFMRIRNRLKRECFDVIHAHYGLSGLISLFVFKIGKVVTFHGSDVNKSFNNPLSTLAAFFSNFSIFVSESLYKKILVKPNNYSIIPCGIDFETFYPVNQQEARSLLGISAQKKLILFSSAFDNKVKNSPLAIEAINLIEEDVELLELKNKSREEVNLLFNASDLLLMTSFTEGSPQVVKEALACNTPVISTDVGDVKELIKDLDGCYIVGYDAGEISEKIREVLFRGKRTEGRQAVEKFDLHQIAREIREVYHQVSQSR